MAQKISLDGIEYDLDQLSTGAREQLASLQYVTGQLQEATNMQALLTKAKNAYVAELKAEMVQARTGFLFDDD